jgi:hypothetical protein
MSLVPKDGSLLNHANCPGLLWAERFTALELRELIKIMP